MLSTYLSFNGTMAEFNIVFMVLCFICQYRRQVAAQGPPSADDEYTLNFESPIYVCSDEASQAFVDTSNVEVQRYNESTAFLTGVIKFLKNFEYDTMVDIVIEKESNGRLERVGTHAICDVCKEMSDPESIYYTYLQYFGFPAECPFDANEYKVNDLVADTSELPINGGNVGKYLVTMNLLKNPSKDCKGEKEFIGCLKLEVVVEPV